MNDTTTTITLGQIIDARGLPEGATAVVWYDNMTVESRYQVDDSSWQDTAGGLRYDRATRGQLVYDEIPDGAVAWMFTTPTESARWLTADDARLVAEVRAEDPSLVAVFADYDDSHEQ